MSVRHVTKQGNLRNKFLPYSLTVTRKVNTFPVRIYPETTVLTTSDVARFFSTWGE